MGTFAVLSRIEASSALQPTRHHLAPITVASRTDLAAFGTDLAASRADLTPSRTNLATMTDLVAPSRTDLTPSRTDLAASRAISHHLAPIAAASRTSLAHRSRSILCHWCQSRTMSRTDLPPSGPISALSGLLGYYRHSCHHRCDCSCSCGCGCQPAPCGLSPASCAGFLNQIACCHRSHAPHRPAPQYIQHCSHHSPVFAIGATAAAAVATAAAAVATAVRQSGSTVAAACGDGL